MSLEPLSTWKSEFALLPKVADSSWKSNLGDYIEARVNSLLDLSTYSTGVSFTFDKTTFEAALAGVDALTGDGVDAMATGFGNALATGLVVSAGASFSPYTPQTTFSSVTSSTFDAASITAGENKIKELNSATPVDSVNDSLFPLKLREAFLLLTATVIGLDSTPMPTGPLPLTDTARGTV